MDHQLTDDAVIKEADTQHSKMTEDGLRNAYDFLIKYKDSANADVLWRIARAAIELSERTVLAKEEKKELTQKALELATKALEADEQNWACHKWFPIALEGMGSYLGIEKQISEAFIVKDHLEKSRQLNPNDAMTVHRIGRWHKVYSDLNYFGRKIYIQNFGVYPTSTNKDALEMFELAEKMEPRFYSVNLLNLGSCYEKAGDVKRAIDIWKMMFDFDATNEEDKESSIGLDHHNEWTPFMLHHILVSRMSGGVPLSAFLSSNKSRLCRIPGGDKYIWSITGTQTGETLYQVASRL